MVKWAIIKLYIPEKQPDSTSNDRPLTLELSSQNDVPPVESPTVLNDSIKDFFIKKLSPLLVRDKNAGAGRSKAIKRAYGESLTSQECLKRLEAEAAEKAAKASKKRQPKKTLQTRKLPAARNRLRRLGLIRTI